MQSNDLINKVVKSTLHTIQIDPRTQMSTGTGSGCLIAYKGRLFFASVVDISDRSGLQIVLETGKVSGATTYPLPGLRFAALLNSEGVSGPEVLRTLSLCYAEIKETLELNQEAIPSDLASTPGKDDTFVFDANTMERGPASQNTRLVTAAKHLGKAGIFEQFLPDASAMELPDFEAAMGAPIFSETGELAALVTSMEPEQKILYSLSLSTIRQNLDEYIDQNPIQVIDDALENFHLSPVKKEYITYSVLYGTNRTPLQKSNKLTYTGTRDHNLHLGYCNISIPLKHEMGQIERPSWFNKLFFNESPAKYFTILSNEQIEATNFMDLLRQKLGQSDEKDTLLFIHGFNVEFNEAMMRAAQLGYDLNFKGGVAAFSWPSLGMISGYIADSDSANYSRDYLSAFIKLLILNKR